MRARAPGGADNQVYFSALSGWEIANKSRLGPEPLPEPPSEFVIGQYEVETLC